MKSSGETGEKIKIKLSWKLRSDKKCFYFYDYNETIFHRIYNWKTVIIVIATGQFCENVLVGECQESCRIQWKTMASISILNGIVKFKIIFICLRCPTHPHFLFYNPWFYIQLPVEVPSWNMKKHFYFSLSITCNFFCTFQNVKERRSNYEKCIQKERKHDATKVHYVSLYNFHCT